MCEALLYYMGRYYFFRPPNGVCRKGLGVANPPLKAGVAASLNTL